MSIKTTKELILDEGIALFRRHGYYGTSIKMVLSTCGVPKGSFYYYFDSKEDFALAAVDQYAQTYLNMLENINKQPLSPVEKIIIFFGRLIDFYSTQQYKQTCLMSILSFDVGSEIPSIRQRIESHFTSMKAELASIIQEAQEHKNLTNHVEARSLAEFFINSFNGALISMKYRQSGQPLRDFQATTAKLIGIAS